MHNEDRGSAHPRVLDEYLLRAIPVYLIGSFKAEKVALPVTLWNFRLDGTRRH